MHHDDEVTARITAMVTAYVNERVALDDPPLDHSITMSALRWGRTIAAVRGGQRAGGGVRAVP